MNHETPARLNLGSGRKYMPGATNVDLTAGTGPDVVHDLNVFPWPFATSSFDEVHAYDVIEHLADVLKTLEEIHRVTRPGGVLIAHVPHYSSDGAFTDPTHRQYFGARTFDYLTEGHPQSFYTDARFRVLRRQIVFRPTLANKVVHRLANRYPDAYEERWAWIFPAWFLYVRLEVVK
ncbi:MAG TPA: methyltransferase domain-containing protein [Polyangiaceae bacterium]|nr:methyltransferase domain-containing protein [Polyangiaceae bacterium]